MARGMFGYDMDIDPGASVATLNRIALKAENMRPVFTVVRDLMLKDQAKNFDAKGSTFGDSWPALAPGSLARKAGGGKTLVLTGALEKAVKGGTGKTARITKTGVKVGVNGRLYYARFHQAGAKGGKRKGDMPMRPVVGITDQTRKASVSLIQKYLDS